MKPRTLTILGIELLVALQLAAPARAESPATEGLDFNGDGFPELVATAPGVNIAGEGNGYGYITVLYGSTDGPRAAGAQRWFGANSDAGTPSKGEVFGEEVAGGDLDADGFDDLVIGVPERIVDERRAGVLVVLYGSRGGLASHGSEVWHLNRRGVPGKATKAARLGTEIQIADFDGDGFDDIAAGIPHKGDVDAGLRHVGKILVLFGSSSGVTAERSQLLGQGVDGIEGVPEHGDQFGYRLDECDFNADGHADLVASSTDPEEGPDGSIHVIYGSKGGLQGSDDQVLTPRAFGDWVDVQYFGLELTCADFDGSGLPDLAVWMPRAYPVVEPTGGYVERGYVGVMLAGPERLEEEGSQLWYASHPADAGDELEEGEGRALVSIQAADVNGDGFSDLAVGVAEPEGDPLGAGAVVVIFGSDSGLVFSSDALITQGRGGIGQRPEAGDDLGSQSANIFLNHDQIGTADYNGDGRDDLVLSAPGETINGTISAGLVHIVFGSTQGPTGDGDQIWHAAKEGVPGRSQSGAYFGVSVI